MKMKGATMSDGQAEWVDLMKVVVPLALSLAGLLAWAIRTLVGMDRRIELLERDQDNFVLDAKLTPQLAAREVECRQCRADLHRLSQETREAALTLARLGSTCRHREEWANEHRDRSSAICAVDDPDCR